jgi:hypothetical protein
MQKFITGDIEKIMSDHKNFTIENMAFLKKLDDIDWELMSKAEEVGFKQVKQFSQVVDENRVLL